MSRFTICTAEQRSEDWFAARAGRATGSKAATILAQGRKKGEEAVTRRDYRVRLAVEQITGKVSKEDDYLDKLIHIKRGVADEPNAVLAYEAYRGEMVRRTGFLSLRDHKAGCSLDFDVPGSNPNIIEGFAEIKCPKQSVHLETIEANEIPMEHAPQLTHNFWVSGAKWCDFVSYNGNVPEHLQLFVVRIERDDDAIKLYEAAVLRFLAEVDLTAKKFRDLKVAA